MPLTRERHLAGCLAAASLGVIVLTGYAVCDARAAQDATPAATQTIDLASAFAGTRLRAVNRQVTTVDGQPGVVRVSEGAGAGVIWIEGTDFAEGVIAVDVRGRDLQGQSFVGLAFHRTSDDSYEGVYLRPFNFRTGDPARRQHAVQYIAVPDYDWPRLRQEFPEQFESSVDPSLDPEGWVTLRVAVSAGRITIHAGDTRTPALEVRALGAAGSGLIGLWVGNGSNGDFANLRIAPAR